MLEADAEGLQGQNLDNKRKHEERMASVDHLANLMRTNKVIIGGKNGEDLLNFFKETQDMVFANP